MLFKFGKKEEKPNNAVLERLDYLKKYINELDRQHNLQVVTDRDYEKELKAIAYEVSKLERDFSEEVEA